MTKISQESFTNRLLSRQNRHDYEEEIINKKIVLIAGALVAFLCVSLFYVSFIVDFSSGSPSPRSLGGTLLSGYSVPLGTTNETTVNISMGYYPARGVVLYCTYTVTNSNHKVIDGSVMLHSPFSSEYFINKTLTNLADGNCTFTITAHYANGRIDTPENETFTVDTSFIYPVLTVISPRNQTYNSNQVDITYHINSKVLYSYYSLDNANWVWFNGNMTLNGLSTGLHELQISVVTEANAQTGYGDEAQTIYFSVNPP
ncbi:MAG: hypothetical protein ABSF44_03770 [Candidatus Bathyarchaeia archaeon]